MKYISPTRGLSILTSNLVYEYQPIASQILTQSSRCKRGESNLLSDEIGPQHWTKVVNCLGYTSIFIDLL